MAELDRILALVKTTTGVDFTQYRDSTIGRRVERRAALLAPAGLADYARLLEQEPAEVQALYQDLLINVTSFFRDPEVFEALKRVAFPALLAGTTRSTPIRLWVPGCSTGQEPYSLAIALLEFLEGTANPPPVQIFGSDLADEAVLGQARAGRYPASIADEVSPERLARFFRRDGDDYVVRRALRELCVFARHDLTADPPFSRIDLISCRNVLIYMTPPLQQRVLPVFHYALNQPGFLVLGSSEAVSGSFGDLFELVEIAPKLYRKLDGAGRSVRPQLSEAFFLRHPPAIPAKPAAGPASPPPAPPPAPTGWRRWLQPWTTETPETDRLRQELLDLKRCPGEKRWVDSVIDERGAERQRGGAARCRRHRREVTGQHRRRRHEFEVRGGRLAQEGALVAAEEEHLVRLDRTTEGAASLVTP